MIRYMLLDMLPKTPVKSLGALAFSLTLVGAAVATEASASQRLVVEKDHSTRISLSGPAGSVIVANPNIADVNVVDSRTVYIVGKGYGNSSVIITDQMGRSMFDGEVVVTPSQKGAITVYKGLTPSTVVCSNICTSDTAAAQGTGATQGAATP
jgi:Flp pilus assembly secretin CpaC